MNHVQNKFFYTYVLKSLKSGKLYIGYTNDLRKRFKEHNDRKSTYTKGKGPYTIIYYEAGPKKHHQISQIALAFCILYPKIL
jgi:putative endonuclease